MSKKDITKETKKEKIIQIDIVREMKTSYLDYAMSVIVMRALPDVRDGLKPVHRRILYAMHEAGMQPNARFTKSAAVVGDVLKKYHPHGDSSVYDAMVKLAQDFSTRYPLVMPQGNFGSIDGDPPAAYRYTEAKLSKISTELLKDLGKDTVDFRPNYDNTKKEPIILPARIPNLLLNGTLGIAVGMATKIPPHNLEEITSALIHLVDNPKATTEDLLEYVKGPDFPLGGIVFNDKDIREAYTTGRGGVVCRGETEIVEDSKGQSQIIISSIPYQVNKSELIIKIADMVHDKKLDGIKDVRDESTTDIRVVVDLKTGGYPQKVLNTLYKHTDLEITYHFNMLALSNGVPKLMSLRDILSEFVDHRTVVVRRRTKFDLAHAEEHAHILEGLKKALDHIDAIIKTIKQSKDAPIAHTNLIKEFKFSSRQATAILEMKLQRLAGLERKKIEDDLKKTIILIKELKDLLASPKKLATVIKNEFKEIENNYKDGRRTKIIKRGVRNISVEDLVPDVDQVLVLTNGGYVKRTSPSEYKRQKRGGMGVIDMNTKEEDFVNIFLTASTHSDLLFFTDKGKVYQIKMYDIPEGKRATKGKSIMNYLPISEKEAITSVRSMQKAQKEKEELSLIMVTKKGIIKKVSAKNFEDVRKSGIVAIKLAQEDKLLSARFVEKGNSIILVTKYGQSIRFNEKDVRKMGRTAAGVRAITLKKYNDKVDEVVFAVVARDQDKENSLLVVFENGFGKRTKLSEYKIQKRGGSGVKTAKITAKTGKLIKSAIIGDKEAELLAISKHGQIIRISISEVPTLGRQTQGVKIMQIKSGDSVASMTLL